MVNEALADKGIQILKAACQSYLGCSEGTG